MPQPVSLKATRYRTNVDQGVVDKNNKHYFGPTGKGAYNLDTAYGLKSRPNEAERLAAENMKEFYRNLDAAHASDAKSRKTS
ncbi:hypothetical protein [Chelativorans sp. Marseille-P2723]|uniref:hypothetical protein n=1 Tax=Chelativorans sp. Marseille-P2723 TaxID=2709133 RepID=UPI00156E2A82|nr:hypothetical protein [Chelativorans sp. Marseille-P2723]